MEEGSIDLLSKPPKRKKETNFKKCLICQTNSEQVLRKAKDASISKFAVACKARQDDVFHRLSGIELENEEIHWHSSCYEVYTSKENLRYATHETETVFYDSACPRESRQRIPFDWQTKCLFCKKASHKKDKQLIKISTVNACESIKQSANNRGDVELLALLHSVDLIAEGGRYHKDCHAIYTSAKNVRSHSTQKSTVKVNEFEEAFQEFLSDIKPAIGAGKAFDMNALLHRYQECLEKRGIDGRYYTRQKLKDRLKNAFQDSLVFHQPFGPSKPEIVFSSSISLLDVINATGRSNSLASSKNESAATSFDVNHEDPMKEFYFMALSIRKEIQQCQGIDILPLNTTDLTLEKSKSLIPKTLYWLVRWMVTGEDFKLSQFSCPKESDERKIIMTAQDIIHSSSHARIKLPKHVGLAMTVKHLTGSKQLITLLNRMGHCSSYDETEQIETSLANETLAKAESDGVIIPSNISRGAFIHMAADNNDINEETLDGRNTTHATTLVVYQRNDNQTEPPERTVYADHSTKKRSLNPTSSMVTIEEVAIRGRRRFRGENKDGLV